MQRSLNLDARGDGDKASGWGDDIYHVAGQRVYSSWMSGETVQCVLTRTGAGLLFSWCVIHCLIHNLAFMRCSRSALYHLLRWFHLLTALKYSLTLCHYAIIL
jgi:hypothetical protein